MAALGLAMRPTDPAALHYRHLGTLVARQLQRGTPLDAILLDRARGYTTATSDPITGGAHCSLGGDPRYDYLVTSTLASQGPQAVGRALAIAHISQAQWPSDAISLVTCGDGSINNSEWLSAINAAEYIQHRRRACPALFAITDNGVSISLKGFGWTEKWARQRLGMQVFKADGSNLAQLMRATCAQRHARKNSTAFAFAFAFAFAATAPGVRVFRRFRAWDDACRPCAAPFAPHRAYHPPFPIPSRAPLLTLAGFTHGLAPLAGLTPPDTCAPPGRQPRCSSVTCHAASGTRRPTVSLPTSRRRRSRRSSSATRSSTLSRPPSTPACFRPSSTRWRSTKALRRWPPPPSPRRAQSRAR